MAAVVVNKRVESFDVYIGRGSPWGNPWRIGPGGTRDEVIRLYAAHLRDRVLSGATTVGALVALDGQRLGCFCAPQACHGDVLAAAIPAAIEAAGLWRRGLASPAVARSIVAESITDRWLS